MVARAIRDRREQRALFFFGVRSLSIIVRNAIDVQRPQ